MNVMRAPPPVFVLVHGAWHGGWCWREVRAALEAAGYRVFTPTQTGLGERAHLLSRAITLETFVEDIANVLRFEDLADVVLVGHSFGGLAISGVADRMPERLRHLVYLDSMLLEAGQSPFDTLTPEIVAGRIQAAEETSGGLSLPFPKPKSLGILTEADAAKIAGRLTPHPLSTYRSPLALAHPLTNGVPATYVHCTAPVYTPLASSRNLAAARGIPIVELATGHDAMITAPLETADLLMNIASK
jgi:pimeloyl-ACP methyl ester carboxylesterase